MCGVGERLGPSSNSRPRATQRGHGVMVYTLMHACFLNRERGFPPRAVLAHFYRNGRSNPCRNRGRAIRNGGRPGLSRMSLRMSLGQNCLSTAVPVLGFDEHRLPKISPALGLYHRRTHPLAGCFGKRLGSAGSRRYQMDHWSKMRTRQLSTYAKLSQSYFKRLRRNGGGPPYSVVGRLVIYDKVDVDIWLAERRICK